MIATLSLEPDRMSHVVGRRTERDERAANACAGGQTREAKPEAAVAAIGLILEEVGPFAALILLNASISAVEDRVRGFKTPLHGS